MRRLNPVLWSAAPLVVVHLGLLWVFDLGRHPLATQLLLAAAMLCLVLAVHRLRSVGGSLTSGILIIAALLRVILLPLPPTLSDDILRYVWDGRVAAAGENPYRLAPEALELTDLRDPLWERLPHRQVPTVYPPLALSLFSIAARLPAPQAALKLLLSALDLLTCWLLLAIARRYSLPPARVAWYAWNPLVVLEVAGMGHVDALGVAAVAATLYWLARHPPRRLAAALTAAAAVLAKLVPVVVLPVWARHSRRPFVFVAVCLATVAIAIFPVMAATGGVPPGLAAFGVSWEFNGPLYEPLWRLLDTPSVHDGIEGRLDRIKDWSGRRAMVNRIYPYNYPQLLARVLLAFGAAPILVLAWRDRQPLAATGRTFGVLLLFSATVYPWYLLWVLPWAALARQQAWILLSGLLLLSYYPQTTSMDLFPWVFLVIWTPFLAVLIWRPRWSFG